ncbi:hypothetical protein A2U01_0101658, partial [Trifolium medium]|nr:hypothetical protein [Trifolium medium]
DMSLVGLVKGVGDSEGAGGDPGIGSAIGCGNSHLGEIVGFQV